MKHVTLAVLFSLTGFLGIHLPEAQAIERSCMDHSLENSFPNISAGSSSRYFVTCHSRTSRPQSGARRPHYDETKKQEIYEAFIKVSQCLEIETQWLFPKIMLESGFHPTIQNPNGDAGVGQLTGPAISDVDRSLNSFKRQIWQSSNPSCQWLKAKSQEAGKEGLWEPVGNNGKCDVMVAGLNPLKNILYIGIFHKLNTNYIDREYAAQNIEGLLQKTGFPLSRQKELKSILLALGYNSGGRGAVRNLRDFLNSRIDFMQRKSEELWKPEYRNLPQNKIDKLIGKVQPGDFDFLRGLANLEERKKSFRLEPTIAKANSSQREYLVEVALRNVSVSELSFPEWLKIWQSHGGPGYMSHLALAAQKLDAKFGKGICSNSSHYRIDPTSF